MRRLARFWQNAERRGVSCSTVTTSARANTARAPPQRWPSCANPVSKGSGCPVIGRRGPAAGSRRAVRKGGMRPLGRFEGDQTAASRQPRPCRALPNACLRPKSPRQHGDDKLDALWPRAAAGVSRGQWPVHGSRRSVVRVGAAVAQVVGARRRKEAASRGSRVRVVGAGS